LEVRRTRHKDYTDKKRYERETRGNESETKRSESEAKINKRDT